MYFQSWTPQVTWRNSQREMVVMFVWDKVPVCLREVSVRGTRGSRTAVTVLSFFTAIRK